MTLKCFKPNYIEETKANSDWSIIWDSPMVNKSEYLLKICVIGSGNVQKTEIIRKYAEDKFDGNYLPTLGVDITTKKIKIKETHIKIIIVDAAGQEFFGKLRPNYYRGASGALFFCNLFDRKSIESIPSWIKEFKRHIPSPSVPMSIVVLINQKVQKEREIEKPIKLINSKHRRRKRTFLKFIKKILFSRKKKTKHRKISKRKKGSNETPKEWLILSNSELVSHLALKHDLGICKVDMKNTRDISKCFSHIAEQVIKA